MAIDKAIANTIVDSKAYGELKPIDAAFTYLRREQPFDVATPDDYDPFWVACKHADILEIERRSDIFLNGAGPANLVPRGSAEIVRAMTGEPNLIRSLVAVDGAEHQALRAISFPAFTPKALRELTDFVGDIARAFAAHMVSLAPRCDFAKDVAFLYPLRVVMKMLGVPEEDEPVMLKLTQELFGANDPDMNRSGQEVEDDKVMGDITATMLDMEAYFDVMTQKFRANPTQHLNSLIANARTNGAYLTRRQMMGYYIIAATAGHDTTSNTTAAAFWALAERPALLKELQARPELIEKFVEESIRWATPVKTFMRTAVKDAEIRGKQVKAGDWILLSYHSANRDEDVFENPFEFDIHRAPNKQLAFGSGPHVCLGQHLARMEMKVLWEELLPRLASVELDGQPQLTKSTFVQGPKTVPVKFTVR